MKTREKPATDPWEAPLAELWRRSRFASYFYQSVHFASEEAVPTLALTSLSSRFLLLYNPDFVKAMTHEELIGLLVHEMLHVVLRHDHRTRPGGDAQLQNLAQDMVVNTWITDKRATFFSRTGDADRRTPELNLPAGLPRIPRGFFEATGNQDPAWEEVYRWLQSRSGDNYYTFEGTVDTGGLEQGLFDLFNPREMSFTLTPDRLPDAGVPEARLKKEKRQLQGLVFADGDGDPVPTGTHIYHDAATRRHLDTARNRVMRLATTDTSCHGERAYQEVASLIGEARQVDISSWKHQLKSIVDYSSQSGEWTYTYGRFNKRFFSGGVYAPGRVFREKQLLTIAVDVSASMVMKPGEIEAAFGAIEELLGKYQIYLLCIDEQVFVPEKREDRFIPSRDSLRPYRYRKGDWRYIRTGSSGTTFFAPLFNRYMQKHREMLVVITDGYIYDLQQLRKYEPTLWVISGNREEPFVPPFGHAVAISTRK